MTACLPVCLGISPSVCASLSASLFDSVSCSLCLYAAHSVCLLSTLTMHLSVFECICACPRISLCRPRCPCLCMFTPLSLFPYQRREPETVPNGLLLNMNLGYDFFPDQNSYEMLSIDRWRSVDQRCAALFNTDETVALLSPWIGFPAFFHIQTYTQARIHTPKHTHENT